MVAIMLSGFVAYTFLPLSTLPEVDYPTIQVQTLYPGASPEVMTSSVTAPLERQFGQMPGLEPDDVGELGRRLGDHAAVQPRSQPRRRRAGGPGRDQCLRQSVAGRSADAADLRQGQSGRCADTDAGGDVENAGAHRSGRFQRDPARAENLAADRRRPGQHQRRRSGRPCAFSSIRNRSRPMDSMSTTSAPRSAISTSIRRRETSTARPRH